MSEELSPLDKTRKRIAESDLEMCLNFRKALQEGNCDSLGCASCPIPRPVCTTITGRIAADGNTFNFCTEQGKYSKEQIVEAIHARILALKVSATVAGTTAKTVDTVSVVEQLVQRAESVIKETTKEKVKILRACLSKGNCSEAECGDCALHSLSCSKLFGPNMSEKFVFPDIELGPSVRTRLVNAVAARMAMRPAEEDAEESKRNMLRAQTIMSGRASSAQVKTPVEEHVLNCAIESIGRGTKDQAECIIGAVENGNCNGHSCSACAMPAHMCSLILGNEKGRQFHYARLPSGRDVENELLTAAYKRKQSFDKTRHEDIREPFKLKDVKNPLPSYNAEITFKHTYMAGPINGSVYAEGSIEVENTPRDRAKRNVRKAIRKITIE